MAEKSVIDYFNKGMKAYREDNYETALYSFSKSLQVMPSNPRYLSYSGLLMVLTGKDFRTGFDNLRKAIELDPDRGEFYHNIFIAYMKIGNRKKAFDYLYEGDARDPDYKEIKRELKRYGRRMALTFKFLSRGHFLNTFGSVEEWPWGTMEFPGGRS
jgi:tetratricopeptide (TPR) repeat protein